MFSKKKEGAEPEIGMSKGGDDLDSGIRELVRGLQEEQFKDLRAEMEQRLREVAGMGPDKFQELGRQVSAVESGLKSLRSDVAKWLDELREAKRLGEEAAQLKKRVEEAAGAGSEGREAIRKDIAGLREAVASAGKQQKELVQQAANELRMIKERTEALARLESELGRLKGGELRRDIEALKAKAQWLEQQLGGGQLAPGGGLAEGFRELEGRVEELEALVARLKGASPVVLE